MTVTSIDTRDVDRRIGLSIKLLCRLRGRTIKSVARAVGMSYSSINDRLAGRRRFLASEVAAFADELGVEVAVLYRGEDLLPCTYRYVRWSEPLFTKGAYQTFPFETRERPFVSHRPFTRPCRVSNFPPLPRGGQVRPRSERWSGG